MPSLGPAEILVILVVALLVFGPNKMPEIGRQVARGIREFRRVQEHLSTELHNVVSELDPTAPSPAPATSGGDPVPTLPPKDRTDTPATSNMAAAARLDDTEPSPKAAASDPSGEPPSSPPADLA